MLQRLLQYRLVIHPPMKDVSQASYNLYVPHTTFTCSSCRSDDLSDQEAEAAAAPKGDQAVPSEPHSPGSRDSGAGSESSSGSDTSSASELADLEDEQEAVQSSEVDVAAPRAKRHRAAASPHDTDLLEERHGTPGEINACCVAIQGSSVLKPVM